MVVLKIQKPPTLMRRYIRKENRSLTKERLSVTNVINLTNLLLTAGQTMWNSILVQIKHPFKVQTILFHYNSSFIQ